jgi:hypothetical protein
MPWPTGTHLPRMFIRFVVRGLSAKQIDKLKPILGKVEAYLDLTGA